MNVTVNKNILELTPNALHYTLRELAHRIGVDSVIKIENGHKILDANIFYSQIEDIPFPERSIVIIPCDPNYWNHCLTSEPIFIHWIDSDKIFPNIGSKTIYEKIPVLAWGIGYEDGKNPFVEQLSNGTIVFYADILASIFFMLSRWEETTNLARDEHDRFPGEASFAFRNNFLDRPIVDEYAIIFASWLKTILIDWKPKKKTFSIMLSHDIDHIFTFPSILELIKRIGGDLFHRHSLKLAWKSMLTAINERISPYKQSEDFKAIFFLADQSKSRNLQSTFFFMATKYSAYDSGYKINSLLIRQCINLLLNMGFRIGLHPSYQSYNNQKKLASEMLLFEKASGLHKFGCRQHYLRFKIPTTWKTIDSLGMLYDSSMTYSHHVGFRCGTCYPFHPYDLENDCQLSILEEPLIVMEGSMLSNPPIDLNEVEASILLLAKRCKTVGGVFTLLWHNRTIVKNSQWSNFYLQLLDKLVELQHGNE